MPDLYGPSNKILEVNLNDSTFKTYTVSQEERQLYLGAKGLGLKLLYDRLTPGIDPLGPENILAIMPGVLLGTGAPCSGRFHALAKSPLTGIMTTSSCGGPFGMQLKTAGWDGLILKGKSPDPIYLDIDSQGVNFLDATDLWGKEKTDIQQSINEKKTANLVIGPAGENLVRFANIISGDRFLGRGGLGAVLGSKMIKAIVARGDEYKIRPADSKKFARTKKKANQFIKQNRYTGFLYRKFGTRANVNPNNAAGILPVNNFTSGRHDNAYKISGENINMIYTPKHHTCTPCSILCGQKASFTTTTSPVPEYETISLLGSNLGIFDVQSIAEWNNICGELGLDTMSTGSTLGWVMEAYSKKLLDFDLNFGSPQGVSEAIYDIGYARGFGKEMGQGINHLTKNYGGEDFAIQVKGMEMAGYDPRGSYGQGLSYAVANRGGCHLSAYLTALEIYFGLLNPYTSRAKAEFVTFFEALTNCVNSLQTCQFTMFAYLLEPAVSKYTPDTMLKFLMQNFPGLAIMSMDFSIYTKLWNSVVGENLSNSQFLEAGHRIHLLERYMNTREGIDHTYDTLPPRMLNEKLFTDRKGHTVPLDKMLQKYYKLRGFDEQGIPKNETLKKYGILKT